jgi:hypothetical protein
MTRDHPVKSSAVAVLFNVMQIAVSLRKNRGLRLFRVSEQPGCRLGAVDGGGISILFNGSRQ